MKTRSSGWSGLLVLCIGASVASAQKPRVRVDFRVVAAAYTDAFAESAQFVSDSGAALLADIFRRRLGFLSYTGEATDTAAHVLVVRLEESGGVRDYWDEVGLRLELANPLGVRDTLYWLVWRGRQGAREPVEAPEAFLALFRHRLEDAVDAEWSRAVRGILKRIPIADTGAVWGKPTQWLLPYRPSDLCIDETSQLMVRNILQTEAGPERATFTVVPKGTFEPPPLRPEDARFERFRGFIRAKQAGDAVVVLPPDSTLVTAVYVTEYHFDLVNCRPLRSDEPEERP